MDGKISVKILANYVSINGPIQRQADLQQSVGNDKTRSYGDGLYLCIVYGLRGLQIGRQASETKQIVSNT
jgi:hypothetical protein